jgi:membrane associated rhomboid family serine protease
MDAPSDRRCPRLFWGLTTVWMLVLVVCFTFQQVVIVNMGKAYDAYLALSGYGIKSGHLWELFTCQVLHRGLIHLLVNLAGLWFLGRAVETRLGSRRFFFLCLSASLAGAVLQGGVALTGFLLPESVESVASFVRERFGGPVVGSSISLCAILTAFCLVEPERSLGLRFGVPFKTVHLLWPALGFAVLLIIVPTDPDLAHIAHLGAMLAVLAIIRGNYLAGGAGS